MRRYLLVVAVALLVAALAAYGFMVRPVPKNAMYEIPGMGVKLALPEGVSPPPFGAIFRSSDRTITIAVSVSSTDLPRENEEALEQTYPEPVTTFHGDTLDGILHRRTRGDGRTWDGWWLNVQKGKQHLGVMVSYQGNDPKKFEELKSVLSTIVWDGRTPDPETVFGMKVDAPGLQLVRENSGALMYSANGGPDWHQPFILLMALPNKLEEDKLGNGEICGLAATKFFEGKSASEPRYSQTGGVRMCDVHGETSDTGVNYYAAMAFPDGAAIQVVAEGEPDAIRAAIQSAKRDSRL